MTSYGGTALAEICARVRSLGYAASKRIRIYGEELEIVSDPFPDSGGIAIHVRTGDESRTRILRLPAMLLLAMTVKKERFIRAA
jgi:hypothetical protein